MIKPASTPSARLLTDFWPALCSCTTRRQTAPVNEADYASPIRVACVGDRITIT